MLGAPPGFIPLNDDKIVAVRSITGVKQFNNVRETVESIKRGQQIENSNKARETRYPLNHYPEYEPTGETYVEVYISSISFGFRNPCSLAQFSAYIQEALHENL